MDPLHDFELPVAHDDEGAMDDVFMDDHFYEIENTLIGGDSDLWGEC
jgi:hypothetical protein